LTTQATGRIDQREPPGTAERGKGARLTLMESNPDTVDPAKISGTWVAGPKQPGT